MWSEWRQRMYPEAVTIAENLCCRVNSLRHSGEVIHPDQQDILRAVEILNPDKVKVVIIGQDPYHGDNEADGLAFSTRATKIPPSLRNIFQELQDDIGCGAPLSGSLVTWEMRGVLLLNTVLTVKHKEPNSHKNLGWQLVTKEIINVCLDMPQPIVFITWGAQAQQFVSVADVSYHENKRVILSSHPSPLSAWNGTPRCPAFIGSKPFSRANRLLEEMEADPVDWTL